MKHWFTSSILLIALSAGAMAQGYVEILPDEIKNPFFEKHKTILKQLSNQPANEWAGTYTRYVGETWSEVFVWEPANGFAAFRDTCSYGPRAWVNYGGASLRDGVLYLSPARQNEEEFALEFPSKEFTPVKWGDEHWLVPSDKLALFAYAVNSRSNHPYEIAYVKDDSAEERRSNLRPQLPTQYLRFLDLAPIKAKVVEIGAGAELWGTTMTIDAGKDKSVIEGMSLWLVGRKGINVRITVTEVGERSSRVKVIEWSRSGRALDKEIVPVVGWRFASRSSS